MTAIIIDDEKQARTLLASMIKDYLPWLTVIEQCEDLPTGVKVIRKLKPNLIFLDIEMPGHSGLELLDFFDRQEINFGIIYTTAYNQYAIQAIKLQAFDYLLKPIDAEELVHAADRFRQSLTIDKSTQNPLQETIAVPSGQSIVFVKIEDIIYLKAENTYTEIHALHQPKLLISRTLKSFQDTLANHAQFFRCHKSYIVNSNYILNYVKSDGGYLVMSNQVEVPINSESVAEILKRVNMVNR